MVQDINECKIYKQIEIDLIRQESYNKGLEEGQEEAYTTGYKVGFESGYENGYEKGYAHGGHRFLRS